MQLLNGTKTIENNMGKAAKEHRKKVAARNAKIKGAERQYQKVMNEAYRKYLEELKAAQASGQTETQESFTAQ
jgi:hypothetical protein